MFVLLGGVQHGPRASEEGVEADYQAVVLHPLAGVRLALNQAVVRHPFSQESALH